MKHEQFNLQQEGRDRPRWGRLVDDLWATAREVAAVVPEHQATGYKMREKGVSAI